MTEELIPAVLDDLPIGSVMPFLRGKVPDHWIEFNGQISEDPVLIDLVTNMHEQAFEIFEGWDGGLKEGVVTVPNLDRDQVVEMLWGVKYKDAPDVVLAIKAGQDESSD